MAARVAFRNSDDTDWGYLPPRPADAWHALADAFVAVRHEVLLQRWEGRRLARAIHGQARVGPVRLSIGSGRRLEPGWLGIDYKRSEQVFAHNLERPLPLPDGCLDAVLAEHILEHFPLDHICGLLRECMRVLRPGAPLRVVCPDAAVVAELLAGRITPRAEAQLALDARIHGWPQDERLANRVANRLAYQFGQHKSLLTSADMSRLLHEVGFVGVTKVEPTETAYFPNVPGTHFTRFPDSVAEAFALEAVTPADVVRTDRVGHPNRPPPGQSDRSENDSPRTRYRRPRALRGPTTAGLACLLTAPTKGFR
jgi:predicted SAM-dependent methyltransferase